MGIPEAGCLFIDSQHGKFATPSAGRCMRRTFPAAVFGKWTGRILAILFLFAVVQHGAVAADEFIEEEIDIAEILADLPQGLDLRHITRHDLEKLPFWDAPSAGRFIAFRDSLPRSEPILSHLDDIPELTLARRTILAAIPEKASASVSRPAGTIRAGTVFSPGETPSGAKYYTSIRFAPEAWCRIAILAERDAFEPRALDYTSGSVVINPKGSGTTLILGDFRPGFDQGLVWSRYSRTYTSGTSLRRDDAVSMENTAFEETRFLRGGMFMLKHGRYSFHFWMSDRDLDATLDDSSRAVTLRDTGLHLGTAARGNLSERIAGIHAAAGTTGGSLALSAACARYDPPFARESGESSFHDPASDSFGYLSVAATRELGDGSFFLEGVGMNEGEYAAIAGMRLRKRNGSAAFVLREYSPGYWAPRASAISAFGGVSNERGIHAAVQTRLLPGTSLDASYDLARTLERTALVSLPFSRRASLIGLEKRFSPSLRGRISWRTTRDSGEEHGRWSLAGTGEKGPRSGWFCRALFAWSEGGGDGGPYLEAGLRRQKTRGGIDAAVGAFTIPSYAARFYHYERNVPGRGASSAVWGNGFSLVMVGERPPLSVRYRICDSEQMTRIQEVTLQGDARF